ncbi:MAG: hypothetical protein ASUL_05236 [Candidatus Aramenus sulfurataquae]|jgi:sarcosine oxidase subunit beta|uniref:FAD-binding oxidoreductase n=2 Tax=Candidatus Aramenus sulfurataquae TaxID=1326980 RepID=W7L6U4_9CREN|nr:MAG: hypothetical protein ASUL_05236 [Candidatus Aramenus sulfurataquae]MCL7343255.1 FAD-binding oxidoreductase [Candidatus Aramenus sulfurataquae]
MILIVGGGSHGLSLAYHLHKMGVKDVVIIEKKRIGYGSSSRNAGRFRYHFYSKENVEFALKAIRYLESTAKELRYNALLYRSGYLWILSERHLDYFKKLHSLWASLGVGGKFVECREFDFLKAEGNCYFAPQDGAFHHDYILYSYFEEIRRDVKVIYGEVKGVVGEGKVKGVTTSDGRFIEGDKVVVTAGAWSSQIIPDLPIYPERKQIFITEDLKYKVKPLVIDVDKGAYLSQTLKGEIIGGVESTIERGYLPFTVSLEEAIKFLRIVRGLVRGAEGIGIMRGWSGYYEMTPDHSHIMGFSENWPEGLYVDAGYSGHGMMFSPFSGKLMAELIADGKRNKFFDVFSPDRFQKNRLVKEEMVI